MKLIFIGDVFANAGREAIRTALPRVLERYPADCVIANVENAAGGRGVHPKHLSELREWGIDLMTSGNHIFDVKDIVPLLSNPEIPLLRPLNYPRKSPGKGYRMTVDRRGVPFLAVNVMGRIFMDAVDCPFQTLEDLLDAHRRETKIAIVDFHAEASSESRAFGWYFDGKVSAVLGTHTHVQTADEEILPGGTAYITDVGMTGPYRSVIGMDKGEVLKKFTTKCSKRPEAATEDVRFCAVYVEIDDSTGRATAITRIQERLG